MKKLLTLVLTISLLQGYGQIKTSHDYDQQADFSAFKTYKYTEEAKSLDINDLQEKRFFDALDAQLATKGLTKSDNPDLLIDINFKVQQKESATATTTGDFYGGAYRYRWGPTFSTTTINYSEYLEGTIFIDLISTATNQLVWQGRGVGTIKDGTPAQKDKRTEKAVGKIFKKYPPKK